MVLTALEGNLPECLGFKFDCNSTIPACHNSLQFDFPSLWAITSQYYDQCPNGPWLFSQPNATENGTNTHIGLTNYVCEAIAGSSRKRYPGSDVWTRLVQWKLPLFQLVANSPRPPLGFWVELFTITHFLGDPIGTTADVLRKLDGCQSRAMFWQDRLDNELSLLRAGRSETEQRCLWKGLAIIVDSFDEWGLRVGDKAQAQLLADLTRLCSLDSKAQDVNERARERYLKICLATADALAADRSTKFLPITFAQAFFVAGMVIPMIRTQSTSEGPNPTSYVNIEMYSIAFTAQYFWVTFVVFWKSIIGTSQTARAIPRLLSQLQKDLETEMWISGVTIALPISDLDDDSRVYHGGIYAWQPSRRWDPAARNSSLERRLARNPSLSTTRAQHLVLNTILQGWPAIQYLLPFTMVAAAAVTGQLISALVPPTGWSCRSNGMMWMFVSWLASYIISLVPIPGSYRFLFWATLAKDLIAVGITFGIVIATQLGIYNRCDCYTQHGYVGLQLPFMPAVHETLRARLHSVYPLLFALGLAFQLIIVPCLLVWRYYAAVQVFLQRDSGEDNRDWWRTFQRWPGARRYSAVGEETGSTIAAHPPDSCEKGNVESSVEEIELAVPQQLRRNDSGPRR